jgi:hypothetical protein
MSYCHRAKAQLQFNIYIYIYNTSEDCCLVDFSTSTRLRKNTSELLNSFILNSIYIQGSDDGV